MRFSNDKRMNVVLKKRKIQNFEELCKVTEDDYENILLTDPNIGNYKPKENKIQKKDDDDDINTEVPIV